MTSFDALPAAGEVAPGVTESQQPKGPKLRYWDLVEIQSEEG